MQGMQNTNKNIGRMNMPSQFSYGIGNQDGGGSGNLFFTPGEGELPPGSGEGGQPVPGGGIGGWYQPWGENPDYVPSSPIDIEGQVGIGDFTEKLPPWHGGGQSQGPGLIDMPDFLGEQPDQPHDILPQGWEWQFINGNWEPVQVGVNDPNLGGGTIGGGMLQEPIDQPYHTTTYTLEDYAGGGGQGGQAAKRLYYPGTQGGFASVGTGIGGGSTLDQLLKSLQG